MASAVVVAEKTELALLLEYDSGGRRLVIDGSVAACVGKGGTGLSGELS